METDNTDKPIKTFYGPSIVTMLKEQIEEATKYWSDIADKRMFKQKEIYEQSEPDAGRPIHTSDD